MRQACLFIAFAFVLSFASSAVFAEPAVAEAPVSTPASVATDEGWVDLFDGKSIDGWIKRGGKATYAIEEGAIVGTSVANTGNTFLCTPRPYGDFILEVELKVDNELNSGIQIRSRHFENAYTAKGVYDDGKVWMKEIPAGRVHGYQVEIDPSARSWSGGIYDEARRAWINPLGEDKHKPAREAFKRGEWNKYRIECQGNSIKTFVNDVPAADLVDSVDAAGLIGLQVHGVGNDPNKIGKQVRWRNVRIKELK